MAARSRTLKICSNVKQIYNILLQINWRRMRAQSDVYFSRWYTGEEGEVNRGELQ